MTDLSMISTEDLRAELRRRSIQKMKETKAKKKALKPEEKYIEIHGKALTTSYISRPWYLTRFRVELDKEEYCQYVKREAKDWERKNYFKCDRRFIKYNNRPQEGDLVTLRIHFNKFKLYQPFDPFHTKIIKVEKADYEMEKL